MTDSRLMRIHIDLKNIIDGEQKNFQKKFGVKVSTPEITKQLAQKLKNNNEKIFEIDFKVKK